MAEAESKCGKAVPLDTSIPTPHGWRKMGDLKPGDDVFGSDGRPCKVTGCSPVQKDRHLYEIEFSDGVIVRADADHNWLAWSLTERAHGRAPSVVTTKQMLERGLRGVGGKWWWNIPINNPVEYPVRELLVHPYFLGAWLGDGDSNWPALTVHEDDRAIAARCIELEGNGRATWKRDPRGSGKVWSVRIGTDQSVSWRHTNDKLQTRLRRLGVLNNKHIPETYLIASVEQRRELLAGLLDTDGTIRQQGGTSRVELSFCNERLAHDSIELIRSLGYKATLRAGDAKIYGRVVGRRWRINFNARFRKVWKEAAVSHARSARWSQFDQYRPFRFVASRLIRLTVRTFSTALTRSRTTRKALALRRSKLSG